MSLPILTLLFTQSGMIPISVLRHDRYLKGVIVSSQVINETVSVLTRKQGANLVAAHEVAESLLELCEVVPVDERTIREAIRLVRRYKLSHWDSLIVAAALLAGCEKLYSQDMQHGQVFDEQLKVINPFL